MIFGNAEINLCVETESGFAETLFPLSGEQEFLLIHGSRSEHAASAPALNQSGSGLSALAMASTGF